jgi:membrane fusion protein (multidrug efflux system)
VRTGIKRDVVVVPERAVQELQGQHQVGVIATDGRVQIRSVKLGWQTDHSYVVESGLVAGERVIVEGLQNVQPGAKVNAQEEPPAPAVIPDGGATAAAEPRPER